MLASLRAACAAVAAACTVPAAALSAPMAANSPDTTGALPDARVSTWLGRAVKDDEGRTVGTVSDVWLDMSRREPAVLMVAPAGSGTALACRLGGAGLAPESGAFVLHTQPPEREAPCAASPRSFAAGASLESAQTLLGAPIESSDRDDVGRVKDVVVRGNGGRVHYLLAHFSPAWVQDGELTILPARALQRERDNVWIRADLGELQGLPMVRQDRIGDVSAPSFSTAVDRYLVVAAPAR
jgi:sporulation protein YlmC with PRC-barrel domain